MSAPSDGARADARKARAEAVVDIPSGQCNVRPDCTRGLHSWSLTCHVDRDWLAGVIADAKAEALREAADLYRSLGDSLPICAGHVVAELDIRADDWARR